jgi:hypothetical protein
MADYYPLITRAVDGLGASTGEGRRALYERARAALVGQLRAIEPPLSEADITRERLALEDAIRKVEAETVRKSRADRPAVPPRPNPAVPTPATPIPVAPRAPVQPAPSVPRQRDRIGPALSNPPPPRPEPRVEEGRPLPPRPDPRPLRMQSEPAPAAPQAPPPPSARSLLLSARTSPVPRDGLSGFRDVVNDVDDLGAASARSAQSARDTRDSYVPKPQQSFEDDAPTSHDREEPRFDADEPDLLDDAADVETLGPSYGFEDDEEETPFPRQHAPRGREFEEHYEAPRPPRSYRGLAKLAVVLIIIAGITATISWQWSNIMGLYQFVSHMRAHQTQTAQTPAAQPKYSERVPQEQAPGQAPGATTYQNAPAVAQRVVLYEEDQNNPQGRQYVGSAVWRTDTVSPGSGLAPELEVRADITIPDRNMSVTWTLRRNTDQALPASHTIEIMFNLPPDFPGGGIANVPGVLMKDSEQARGVPLAGLAVKVTNGFFLIGLSAVDADVQRNTQLLKDKPWFDIPIVYTNAGRAILALEKGPPGDRAFADAFAAWAK